MRIELSRATRCRSRSPAFQRCSGARKVRSEPESSSARWTFTRGFAIAVPAGGLSRPALRAAAHQATETPRRRQAEVCCILAADDLRFAPRLPRELVTDLSVLLRPRRRASDKLQASVAGTRPWCSLRDLRKRAVRTAMTDPGRPLGRSCCWGRRAAGRRSRRSPSPSTSSATRSASTRFDMRQAAAPGSAVRLVGAYGGSEGALTRRVREQPLRRGALRRGGEG